jgi:uncharacterized RDD family membrane protein YckC
MKRIEFDRRLRAGLLAAGLAAAITFPSPAFAQAVEERDETASGARDRVATSEERPRSVGEVVNVFNNSELKAGRRAEVVVTVFGNAHVEGEVDDVCVTVFGDALVRGRVASECVAVFGNLDLDGEVGGDLVVVMGNAQLGPNTVVHGETIVIGGKLNLAPGATLHGQKIQMAGFLPAIGDWFRYGLLLGRPLPPGVGWVWFVVALHFLLYLLVAALLPRPVEVCEQTLDKQALPAFGIGLLGLILSAPLSFVLLASGVGLLVLPFVILAGMAALVIGKAAMFQWIGRSICRRFNADGTCPPLLGFVAGFVVVTLLYMVPLLGFVVYGLSIPLAFGAALLTVIEVIRANRAAKAPPPAPAFAPPPVTGGPAGGSASAADAALAFSTPATGGPALTPETGGMPAPATGAGSAAELSVLPRAGFWIRTGAAFLDLVLLAWLFAAFPGPLFGPGFVLILIAYHTAMWAWKGTTLGGIVCGLKVVRVDGRPLDWSVALVRSLAAVFSALPLFVGFFWAGWSAERQSWHDKIAGTIIVKMPKGVSLV